MKKPNFGNEITTASSNSPPTFASALAFHRAGRIEEAIVVGLRWLDGNYRNADHVVNISSWCIGEGLVDVADHICTLALAASLRDFRILLILAEAAARKRDWDRAFTALSGAEELSPDNPRVTTSKRSIEERRSRIQANVA